MGAGHIHNGGHQLSAYIPDAQGCQDAVQETGALACRVGSYAALAAGIGRANGER